MADEVVSLTEVYLSVRFGGEPLTSDVTKTFEDRLARLRVIAKQDAARP